MIVYYIHTQMAEETMQGTNLLTGSKLGVQSLAQGLFDMWTGGAGICTADSRITGQPALPPEPSHSCLLLQVLNVLNFYRQRESLVKALFCWFMIEGA